MSKSLRDQLMGAGLATKQQALKAKSSTKKKKKQAVKSGEMTEQEKRRIELEKQKAEQAARDRELNRKLEDERQQKAIQAQVRQLIEMNTISRDRGELGYNFVVDSKVKKIYVTQEQQERLSRSLYAIGILMNGTEEEFRIIPTTVATKIQERIPTAVVIQETKVGEELTEEEKDWYADFEIPDDLMW
ncbi:DUF2058 domain-containing protein [Endozoicomonas sp. OPT23]|uniref:DUF2058 domain-containing protein n=1 Tax=Endozoicomonas sp. OPT23 TaxID=2072845 RepID=UPI00129AF035|nr:DUF2058 domain-containing protein [Endozoicomonas sp. OPT23]MRI32319.1 DUF2058 domain-containing protein [Endozoicomonas sp. OPT23]